MWLLDSLVPVLHFNDLFMKGKNNNDQPSSYSIYQNNKIHTTFMLVLRMGEKYLSPINPLGKGEESLPRDF